MDALTLKQARANSIGDHAVNCSAGIVDTLSCRSCVNPRNQGDWTLELLKIAGLFHSRQRRLFAVNLQCRSFLPCHDDARNCGSLCSLA